MSYMQQQRLKESIVETKDDVTYQIWFDLQEVIVIAPLDLDPELKEQVHKIE